MINCRLISKIVDRLYLYDNSLDNQAAQLLLRMTNGCVVKQYITNLPEWALKIIPQDEINKEQYL
jgi:hypothetical protein